MSASKPSDVKIEPANVADPKSTGKPLPTRARKASATQKAPAVDEARPETKAQKSKAATATPASEKAKKRTSAAKTVKDEKPRKKKDKESKEKKKHKKNKEAVIIRFDGDHIRLIDERAEAIGLTRAAWVRMAVAQALKLK